MGTVSGTLVGAYEYYRQGDKLGRRARDSRIGAHFAQSHVVTV